MKKIFFAFLLFYCFSGFAQPRQVSTGPHTIYQKGKLVGAIYRPAIDGEFETEDFYTEYWILYKNFKPLSTNLAKKKLKTVFQAGTEKINSLTEFLAKYDQDKSTYLTSYISVSDQSFLEDEEEFPEEEEDFSLKNVKSNRPLTFGKIVQNNKVVGAHWRSNEKIDVDGYYEYIKLTDDFIHLGDGTNGASFTFTAGTKKLKTIEQFEALYPTLKFTKYLTIETYESKEPFSEEDESDDEAF